MEDISGPCDEAEHANDPRCTGAGLADDRGGDDDRHGGDNSGPGSANSGHGGGGDDFDDDQRPAAATTSTMTPAAAAAAVTTTDDPRRGAPDCPGAAGLPSMEDMAAGRRNVLIVEDEQSITAPLTEALEREALARRWPARWRRRWRSRPASCRTSFCST